MGLSLVIIALTVRSSFAYDESVTPELRSGTNSQAMALLTPSFDTSIPRAIGGPDAPYIENGVLHPYAGAMENAVADIEQDKDGISYYIVQEGDTVSEIADKFNVSTNTIIWENDLGKSIKPGQELRILPVTGIRHTVAKGDTISSIAKKYEVEVEDISIYNNIDDHKLIVGNKIIVPNGVKPEPEVKKTTSSGKTTGSSTSGSVSIPGGSGYYIKPTTGTITSGYGARWGSFHYGVDYGAPTGTAIVASAAGTVSKTSCGSGYGLCLVIDHDNGTQTLYAHASALYVSIGTQVKQGQKIAAVGNTGRSRGPHLHFEIINSKGQKLNPEKYVK